MKPEKAIEDSMNFITQDLIPEMAHDRCFCEINSREFVEFESASVEHVNLPRKFSTSCEIYRVNAVIRFSGERCSFPLVVKLLPTGNESGAAFDAFQNEEMFYVKMTRQYGTDCVPKCYVADLGRYGRPVVVLEDLLARGYQQVNGKLDEDHLKLCTKVLGRFHGRGLRLKKEKFTIFREFYAKFLEVGYDEEFVGYCEERSRRILDIIDSLPDSKTSEKIKNKLAGRRPMEIVKSITTEVNDVSTICHGHFSPDNLLFKYENGKPIDAKVIDWQTMRYCSPSVDLGPILFTILTCEDGVSKIQEILTIYVDAVKCEYPEITIELLREDIKEKFLFSCFALSFVDKVIDRELLRVLSLLETLGIFD